MFNNASVTITRVSAETDSDTGYRKTKVSPTVVCTSVPCYFCVKLGDRRAFADGVRESTKPEYYVTFPAYQAQGIVTGDEATVTISVAGVTTSKKYTVSDAEITQGIGSDDWDLKLERINTP